MGRFVSLILLMTAGAGCGKKDSAQGSTTTGLAASTTNAPSTTTTTGNAQPAKTDSKWGTLKGRIVWGGKAIPERQPLDAVQLNTDKKHCLSAGPVLDERLIVDEKTKGVRWVFVWLETTEAGGKLPVHPDRAKPPPPAVIDQPICAFEPHSLALRERQEVLVKNSSPVTHSFKWTGHPEINPGESVSVPAAATHTVKGLKAQSIPITMECALHPWMKGYMRVFSHP